MQHLEDITEVGKGIAVAFVATIYGVGMANILFLPWAGKLKIKFREEQVLREMKLEGVISILEGMNPRMLETKLMGYLPEHKQQAPAEKEKAWGQRVSRKKRHKAHANHERWLVSYADFITLLFAFFVVLYASSQADKKKAAQVAASIKGAFQQLGVFTGSAVEGVGVPGSPGILHPELTDAPLKVVKVAGNSEKSPGGTGFGIDVDELRHQLETALGDEIRQHEIQMRVTPEGLVVSLREVGFFNSGQAELLKNGYKTLTRIATILGGRGFEIRVEGHTDKVPVHNSRFKSNWELSTARATAVVSLLIERHGFDPMLVSAAGYSEYRPIDSNKTARGRAANRRVDLVVVGHVEAKGQAGPERCASFRSGVTFRSENVFV